MIGHRRVRNIVRRGRHPIVTPDAEQPARTRLRSSCSCKAFAGGSVALTGVEAIANGVPAFKPPESKNAANTMTAMAILLGILFIGITIVAHATVLPTVERHPDDGHRSSRRASSARGRCCSTCSRPSTALILFLAANTSFNAFPRLAAILAGRRLHAPPVRVPRRPARVHLGDRRPGGRRGGPDLAFNGRRTP